MKLIRNITREEFVSSLTDLKKDRFAKTFVAKCDMLGKWSECRGCFVNDKLAGAILVTTSKRAPTVANLQLLHTFYNFRGQGVGRVLCKWAMEFALAKNAEYFRVSAELDAVDFYEKCGFKFICRQKSAKLSMFRLTSYIISENNFELDAFIWKTMNRKGKGRCIECYVEYKGVDIYCE
jgi:GNAT superfamily N-acetyltransferase